MSDFLNQPFSRDTTPNSGAEMGRRLATLALAVTAVGAPLLAFLAFVQRDEGKLQAAAACAVAALILAATRRRWKGGLAAKPGPGGEEAGVRRSESTDTEGAGRGAGGAGARPRVLLINGSLAGAGGNSARLLAQLEARLGERALVARANLAGPGAASFASLEPALGKADAVVIATGTHWDSWASPLQRFLEDATPAEGTELWLGKPAAVLVTEHSTGGKGVLSRLQGVLVTLGCVIPPMSGLVISLAGQLARERMEAGGGEAAGAADDFWSPADLEVVAHNLMAAVQAGPRGPGWKTWPVDRKDFARTWLGR